MPNLSLSPGYTDGPALLEVTRQRGMEGVVAKRRDSLYRPGRRSPHWVKTSPPAHPGLPGRRLARRSAAAPAGSGRCCSACRTAGGLRYVGKVGAGLTGATAQRVLHERLVRRELPPFDERLPRPDGVGARWCEPLTVVEVAHLGWTEGGRLRQPVYRGDPRRPGRPTQVGRRGLSRPVAARADAAGDASRGRRLRWAR